MTVQSKLTLLVAFGAGLAVLVYNFWSYSCGHCTVASLMTLGDAGLLLLIVDAGLGAIYLALKQWKKQGLHRYYCHCGAFVMRDWKYCSSCGEPNGC